MCELPCARQQIDCGGKENRKWWWPHRKPSNSWLGLPGHRRNAKVHSHDVRSRVEMSTRGFRDSRP